MSGLRTARHSPSRHAVTGPGRQLRPQMVRAAVLPTLAAGLSGAAAVMFTLHLGGGSGTRDDRLWPVLAGCALLAAGALAAALLGAQRAAKAVRDRCEALRRSSVRGREELRTAGERLQRGEAVARPARGDRAGAPPEGDQAGVDEFWLLAQELRVAREQAQATLVRLALPAPPTDSDRKVEVFVNLARRLQSLVHREISLLDGLEDTVEDPDLLKELFHVDHLATRIRRHAENLAVLGGAASRRQWTRPIDLSEVLRSSVAEVEQYTRVKVVPPAGGTVRGHAVADVVHLLAELVENATVFSAPDTDVVVRAERVTAGIAVEVEDRGLGMPAEEQHRMNTLLRDPDQVSVRHLLADGRIGLFVVSALARRHGIAVELKSNIYGGVLAVLVLPQGLLGAEPANEADAAGGSRATSWGTVSWPAPVPVPAPESAVRRETPAPAVRSPLPAPQARAVEPARNPAVPPAHPAGTPAADTDPARAAYPSAAPARPTDPARPAYPSAAPPRASRYADPASAQAPDGGRAPARGQAGDPAQDPARASYAGPAPAPAPDPEAGPAEARGARGVRSPGHAPWDSARTLEPVRLLDADPARGAGPAPDTAWPLDTGTDPGAAWAAAPAAPPVPVAPAAPAAPAAPEPAPPTGLEPVKRPRPGGDPAVTRPTEPQPGPAPAPLPRRIPQQTSAPEEARPSLPRRNAQQHLAPQLRDTPAPRRADATEHPLHDPGLMAAFQRGFGLAQSDEQA